MAGFFTVISFLIALLSVLARLGYVMLGIAPLIRTLAYPLLVILLVCPLEFYLNPWLDRLNESHETAWAVGKCCELALTFGSGLLLFLALKWIRISSFMGSKNVRTARNILDFWYSLSAFGVFGYEAAIVITRAMQAEKESTERFVAQVVAMIILYSAVKIKKKEVT